MRATAATAIMTITTATAAITMYVVVESLVVFVELVEDGCGVAGAAVYGEAVGFDAGWFVVAS